MKKLIPKDKLSKKARKKLAAERRGTWSFSPVTRTVDSRKTYNRKRIPRTRYDDGSGDSFFYRDCFASAAHSSSGFWPAWAFQAQSVSCRSVKTAVKLESSGLQA